MAQRENYAKRLGVSHVTHLTSPFRKTNMNANTIIPANTKCVITSVPDAGGIFGYLLNSNATAVNLMGARNTGA